MEAGCDEAGRGCLAGPVFAAAVILPAGFEHPLLNDSKKMTESARNTLREVIERDAVAWAVASVGPRKIDKINILRASHEAMAKAVKALMTGGEPIVPDMLLIDGNLFRTRLKIPYECIVGGDGKYASIAAASVLAKTHRDEYMERLAARFPRYCWAQNKGYPTEAHRAAIATYGLTAHHRKTFRH